MFLNKREFIFPHVLFTAEAVTNGTIAVKVKWLIITVVDETLDLCTVAKEAGLSCPIAAGTHSVKITATIPSIAPSVREIPSMFCFVSIVAFM